MDAQYEDRYWNSADGLSLHYRHYDGPVDKPPLVCLHGLSRNARDFANLCERHAGDWRIIVPEMRGRGMSEHAKDPATYAAPTYLADLALLFEQEDVERFVSVGTSMGGLLTMLMAQLMPGRIAGALLNDIGPVIDPAGIEHIRTYLGHQRSFPTWVHAARALQETQSGSYPDFALEDWLAMAKRSMVLGQNGRIGFDYDMDIAEPFNATDETAVPPDLWPAFEALEGRPLVLVRGALSTLLTTDTISQMQQRNPAMEVVTIPRVGHAPTLDEPEAVAALEQLLAKVA